ncbi:MULTISPECIES: DUF3768 domain-containing protein [unclassified Sphingopyxis]|nr:MULTISPECIES: DUF3768 domain-containing protein [unclassified Sphingopyxis]
MTEQRHSRSGLHRIYYDLDCLFGSDDPANAAMTTRVITILLPEDW